MEYRIFGDQHGQDAVTFSRVYDTPDKRHPLILGDLGFGFHNRKLVEMPKPTYFQIGNHDSREWVKNNKILLGGYNWYQIPNGVRNGILFIDGGWSPDRDWRTDGVDWFADEEISYAEQTKILQSIDEYEGPINYVVTHAVPLKARYHFGITDERRNSTEMYLQYLIDDVLLGDRKPDMWIHGHMHDKKEYEVSGIKFRCVSPINTKDYLDISSHSSY